MLTTEMQLEDALRRIEALERQAQIADETIANVTAERDRCEERNAVVNDAFATERDRADRIQALLAEESIEAKVLRARLETVERQYQDLRRENLDLRSKLLSITLRSAAGLPLEVA